MSRDLQKALNNIKIFHYDEDFLAVCDEQNGMLSFPLGLVYEAIERAINAEAEVERLKAENAKLRKVVEAARRVMDAVMAQPQDVKERNIALAWLDAALAELNKEGER